MKKQLFSREIFSNIVKSIELGKVTFLLGSRQSGKTSLLHLVLDHFREQGLKCFYLDIEDSRNIPIFESIKNVEAYLVSRQVDLEKDNILLAIDEFYASNNVIKIFKLLCDHYPGIRVMASGSSAVEARANIQESLAGRMRVIDVYPLSFVESLQFKQNPYLENITSSPQDIPNLVVEKLQKDIMIYGGYPKVSLLHSPDDRIDEIYDIYSTYIQKDIRALLGDEDIISFNKLVKLLAAQSGQLLNIASISKSLKISRKTVEKYLFILEKTFVIYLLPPYGSNIKKTVVKIPKLFFVDTGMMNMAIENFTPIELRQNKGSIFETFILAELLKYKKKYQQLYFYRTTSGTEIDFILNDVKTGLIPMEVKYKDLDSPVVPKGMLEFCKAEQLSKAYILNKRLSAETRHNGTLFIFLPFASIKNIFHQL